MVADEPGPGGFREIGGHGEDVVIARLTRAERRDRRDPPILQPAAGVVTGRELNNPECLFLGHQIADSDKVLLRPVLVVAPGVCQAAAVHPAACVLRPDTGVHAGTKRQQRCVRRPGVRIDKSERECVSTHARVGTAFRGIRSRVLA